MLFSVCNVRTQWLIDIQSTDIHINTQSHIKSTCDVEIDLDLLISGGACDFSVPLGSVMSRLHVAALLLGGELPSACGET